jgi:hypothetical protein
MINGADLLAQARKTPLAARAHCRNGRPRRRDPHGFGAPRLCRPRGHDSVNTARDNPRSPDSSREGPGKS